MTPVERAEKIATFKNAEVFSDLGTLMVHYDILREQIATQIREAVKEALDSDLAIRKRWMGGGK